MNFTVDTHHRSQTAAAQTGDSFQRKHTVRSRFTGVESEFLIEPGMDQRSALEVAGGTVAHSDLVLTRFDAFELSIETDDAFDVSFRAAEVFGGGADGIIRNVTVSGLNSLQPFDEIARFRSDLVQK